MKVFFLAAVCFVLTSCSMGVRYQGPTENQDSAEFYGDRKASIYTFNEDGCVASYSYMSDKMMIHANREAFISYSEKIGSDHMCSMWLSFVPEKGGKYELRTELIRSEAEKKSIFIPLFTKAVCTAKIVKKNADGSFSPVVVRRPDALGGPRCHK